MERFTMLSEQAEQLCRVNIPDREQAARDAKAELASNPSCKLKIMLTIGSSIATGCASALTMGLDPLDCLEAIIKHKKEEQQQKKRQQN